MIFILKNRSRISFKTTHIHVAVIEWIRLSITHKSCPCFMFWRIVTRLYAQRQAVQAATLIWFFSLVIIWNSSCKHLFLVFVRTAGLSMIMHFRYVSFYAGYEKKSSCSRIGRIHDTALHGYAYVSVLNVSTYSAENHVSYTFLGLRS